MKRSRFLFRVLLRAYPRAFRDQYGAGMWDFFEARIERARAHGRWALTGLWLSTVGDTLLTASAERAEATLSVSRTLFDRNGATRDVRGALRRLARAPGTSLLTVLLLAVGIAGNVALFTIVNTLLVQSPPGIGDPGRAVEVMGLVPPFGSTSFSYPEFAGMRDDVTGLEELAVYTFEPMAVVHQGGGRPELGMYVSERYFAAAGVEPARGRTFTRAEAEEDRGAPVVVVSGRYWRTRMDGDPGAIGSSLLLNRVRHTVVGIGPADFRGHMGPVGVDLWVPLATHPNFPRLRELWSTSWVEGIGRLAEGVSVDEALAELAGVFVRIREGQVDTAAPKTVTVDPLGSVPANSRGIVGAFLGLLMLLALLALAVLCANVGGMVLARGMAREREIAVRLALGAGRARIVRQFLVESVMLALVGGVAGVWLAFDGLRFAELAAAPILPVPVTFSVARGVPVLLFAAAVAFGTVVVTGLVPALRLVRDDLVHGLKGGDWASGARHGGRLRKLLLGGQIAASTLLLVIAALFVRSLQVAAFTDTGFESAQVYVTDVNLEAEGYGDPELALPVLARLVENVAAVPGVQRASLATDLPMDMSRSTTGVRLEGDDDGGRVDVDQSQVGPGYFEVLGIPIEAGRGFEQGDVRGGELVAVVSRQLADRLWPNRAAVGRRLVFSMGSAPAASHRVVGVVGDVLNDSPSDPMRPMVYGALPQHFERSVHVVVKAAAADADLPRRIRSAQLAVDPQLSDTPIRSMAAVASLALLPQLMAGGVSGGFGLLTVVLAAVGLYGTIAFEVGRRTREIGVRMALGAQRRGLVAAVLADTLRLAAPGFAIGMLGAYAIARLAHAFLMGVPAGDPLAFGGVAAILTVVVAVAAWVPALVASRIHPAEALRHG